MAQAAPIPRYPHLTPTPGAPYDVYVQIALDDVNINQVLGRNFPADCAYVLYKTNNERTRPTRIMFTDKPEDGWRMGSTVALYKSSTSEHLGEYMIVGVKHGPTGESAGELPDRLIKACKKL